MGCAVSQPISPGQELHKNAQIDTAGAYAKAANGGWMNKPLSKDGKMKANLLVEAAESGFMGQDAGSFTVAQLGEGGTRARRMSYVTPDQEMLNKLRAEYAKYNPDSADGSTDTQPVILQPGAINNNQPQSASTPRRTSGDKISLQVSCMSMTGQEAGFKKVCQDASFAFDTFIAEGSGQALFGALDGHGPQGHLVAGALKRHLPFMLADLIVKGGDVKQAMVQSFLQADDLLARSGIDCQYSGSTCSVAYLQGSQLTVAWSGDSRVVLAKRTAAGDYTATDLSIDHKPTLQEERTRIWKAGGRIERCLNEDGGPVGPYRVWLKESWVPGLAMSRSLGDQVAHSVGVASEPQCTQVKLTPSDKFLILASDGVWEFMSSQDAVDLVAACKSTDEAVHTLVNEAYQRWLTEEEGVVDDVTAVVVALKQKSSSGSGRK